MDEHPDSVREYRDALPGGLARGRGAGLNPGNRFEGIRLHVLGEHLDELAAQAGGCGAGTRAVATQLLDDDSRTIINRVDSPDLPWMKWTVNPYRGCEHGCIYCYARPTHEWLGLSSGLDFETQIFAKPNAPALLRKALLHPRWCGEAIMMSGVTDPYQPCERDEQVTRGCLKVMAEFRQAVGIITKSKLILRDLDVMAPLIEVGAVGAAISITSLDNETARKMEPRASSPRDRLAAIRGLAAAGVPVTVMVAPVVPGITDHEIPRILEAAAEAGATEAGYVMVKLPYQIKDLFLDWLKREYPDRAKKVEGLVREVRGGALYDSRHFSRQRGEGPLAESIRATFKVFKARCGLGREERTLNTAAFRPPDRAFEGGQLGLFGG